MRHGSPTSSRHATLALVFIGAASTRAAVQTYGTVDLLGFGYPAGADPTAGAAKSGLAVNATSAASAAYLHAFPFSPSAGDFPGTDQIYVGSNQTAALEGYAAATGRLAGPDVLTLNYAGLVPAGQSVAGLTLGLAADDFQFPSLGQPFTASVNGVADPALVQLLESMDLGGPVERFVSIGIDPAVLRPSGVLTVSIDEGGNGGDGWAIDFATVGVTTAVPEPAAITAAGAAGLALVGRRRRRSGPKSA